MRLFGLHPEYVKRLIKDTIETYSGQWRLVHEAIQNSLDAIQLNDEIDQGKITIDLHVGTNKVVVTDNGKGISLDEFPTIFTLGGTIKGTHSLRKILRGSQGVGIKATVFTSNFFEVKTKYSEGKWSKKIEDCWRFMESDFVDLVEEPELEETDSSESFTTVSYSLYDYSVIDFFQEIILEYCNELEIEEISSEDEFLKLIELYFRTQTYLGCVQSLLGINRDLKPIRLVVNIIFDYATLEDHRNNIISGCSFISSEKYHGRILKHEFPAIYADFKELHQSLKKSDKVDLLFEHFSEPIENPPDPNLKKILIQKLTADQAKMLLSKIKRDSITGKGRLESDDEKLDKHKRFLEKMNGIYLLVGPRKYLTKFLHLSPKQLISVNGLPTNITLNPPRGAGELGYLLNIHFIIDIDTTLGYGKRNIPSVIKGQADAFFADIFRGTLRRVSRAIVGEKEAKELVAETWKKEEVYETYRSPSNPFKDMDIPFRLPPQEEQELISLFHELIGSGRLEGYYPFRASIERTYDALMYISKRSDRKMPARINWTDLKIVEFKVKLSDLIKDFIEQKKNLEDIDLAVVWEDDYEEEEYIVSSLERDGIEPYPEAQKRIRSGTQSCQVLVLKEFLFPSGES